MANDDVLASIVTPIVDELGAELYDLEFNGGVLKVTVTRPGGIDLDTIGEITRRVSRQLDLDDPIPGRYTLEVSSPGLERPLRRPAHWAKAVGELVRVKLKPHVEGDRRLEGTVVHAGEAAAGIDVDGSVVDVAFDDIDRARTVFVWGGQSKPTGNRGGSKGASRGSKGASDELDPEIRAALAGGQLEADDQDLSDNSDPDNESENA